MSEILGFIDVNNYGLQSMINGGGGAEPEDLTLELAAQDTALSTQQIKIDELESALDDKIALDLQAATSDANATASDIALGKSGYVNGVKIVGTLDLEQVEDVLDEILGPISPLSIEVGKTYNFTAKDNVESFTNSLLNKYEVSLFDETVYDYRGQHVKFTVGKRDTFSYPIDENIPTDVYVYGFTLEGSGEEEDPYYWECDGCYDYHLGEGWYNVYDGEESSASGVNWYFRAPVQVYSIKNTTTQTTVNTLPSEVVEVLSKYFDIEEISN